MPDPEPVVVQENGLEVNGKDKHTIIDEIGDNVIKVMIAAFVMWGIGYCMTYYVGKDKGVDPNLVWGMFGSAFLGMIGIYFYHKPKKEQPQP